MKYILFIILMNGNMATAEFADKDACYAAGVAAGNWSDVAANEFKFKTVAVWYCRPVGTNGG